MSEIEELRARVDEQQRVIAALTSRLDALTAPPAVIEETPSGSRTLSRRGLLAAAVAGGAGLVATQVTTAAPAAAAPGNSIVLGAINDGGTSITTVQSSTGLNSSPFAVVNPNPQGSSIGFYGRLGAASGLFTGSAFQRAAVMGDSTNDTAVSGLSANAPGVYGESNGNAGVVAKSSSYMGIRAESDFYIGVFGAAYGDDSTGVLGRSSNGTGVEANSTNGTALKSTAEGVRPAVDAASARGYGVQAKGGRAPLRLVPSAKAGKPTTGNHALGELMVDKLGVLYLCTVAGTPGTWKKVTLS